MANLGVTKEVDQYWRKALATKIKESGLSVEQWCLLEQKKCKADIFYFIDNYVFVKNRFNEENVDEGGGIPKHLQELIVGDRIRFVLYPPQRELVKAYLAEQYVIANKTRQSGISTTAQAIALYMLTFQNNKELLVISKNLEAAKKFLAEMKFMHTNLPWFLRRKIMDDNKTQFSLGASNNASVMFSLTSGKSSGRSASATLLILDEAEFIQAIDEIWSSAAPTLSATGGKAIVISTPWMDGSWFYSNFKNAQKGKNEFYPIEIPWTSIPGRDKTWYKQQCRLLNNDPKKIKTELDMTWIIPGDQFYDEDLLMEKKVKRPIRSEEDVQVYKEPEDGHLYIMGVDVYEGGEDNNAFVIIDLNEKLAGAGDGIVAECVTKELAWFEKTKKWSNYYNNAMLGIERNKGMGLIQEYINEDLENRLVNRFDFKKKQFRDDEFGVFVDTQMRSLLLSMSVKWISQKEELTLDLRDEMREFVRKGVKFQGLHHDDLLFAFLYALYYINIIENYPQVVMSNANLMKFLQHITEEDYEKMKEEEDKGPNSRKIYNALQSMIPNPKADQEAFLDQLACKVGGTSVRKMMKHAPL